MKNLKLTSIFFLIVQLAFGQNKSIERDELLFEKGHLLQQLIDEDLYLNNAINSQEDSLKIKSNYAKEIKENILEKALECYQELIDSFPNSKLLYRTLNNKGFIELGLDDMDEAKKTFSTILSSKADDLEKGGIGEGIMAEPYANYKNRASKAMAGIYIKEKDYNTAIKYLNKTKKFPYQHFCGNDYYADEISMSVMYSKCYIGLNDYEKAYEILLPNILENGLADNSDLVDIAFDALLINYKKEELKYKFEQSFKNYKTEKTKTETEDYDKYFITFLDTKIELSSFRLIFAKPDEKDMIISHIYSNSRFYKLLNE